MNRMITFHLVIPILGLAIGISSPSLAMDCTPASIALQFQEDVVNFQLNHGPCDRITGGLIIEGNDVTNLDGLSDLASVGHSLQIRNNVTLADITGLSALTRVGRHLWIENNSALTDLNGLSGLTEIGENLAVLFNSVLDNVDALSGLTSIGNNVVFLENPELTNIDGLSNLAGIVKDLWIEGNSALTTINGLSAAKNIFDPTTGGVQVWIIAKNPMLSHVDGLSSLTGLYGDLIIIDNEALSNVNGLSALTSLDRLGVGRNASLLSVDGLAALVSVGDLEISNNASLTDLDGLSGLIHVGRNLIIQSNHSLERCTGISKLIDMVDDEGPVPGPGVNPVPDVGGNILLEDNLPGCNSIQEILIDASDLIINNGLNDAWVSTDAPLQGFFFTVFPEIEFFFLSWFTFDLVPTAGNSAMFGADDQRWVTGGGVYSGNSVTVNVELTSGGVFNGSDPLATQHSDYGTITVVFISCNHAILTYDFPSPGLSGEMNLTRALPDNVPLCEVLSAP